MASPQRRRGRISIFRSGDAVETEEEEKKEGGETMGAANGGYPHGPYLLGRFYDEPTQTRHLAANWPPSYRWLASSSCDLGLSESNRVPLTPTPRDDIGARWKSPTNLRPSNSRCYPRWKIIRPVVSRGNPSPPRS